MRWDGDCVQFDGLDGASWRSESESVASAQQRSGSTVGAIVDTRTAGMPAGGWVGDEQSLPLKCPVYLNVWDFIFFCNCMCQDRNFPIVEKVKNPVIDCAQPGSQFINTIPQKICFGSAQFVPEFGESPYANRALGVSLWAPCPSASSTVSPEP